MFIFSFSRFRYFCKNAAVAASQQNSEAVFLSMGYGDCDGQIEEKKPIKSDI